MVSQQKRNCISKNINCLTLEHINVGTVQSVRFLKVKRNVHWPVHVSRIWTFVYHFDSTKIAETSEDKLVNLNGS